MYNQVAIHTPDDQPNVYQGTLLAGDAKLVPEGTGILTPK